MVVLIRLKYYNICKAFLLVTNIQKVPNTSELEVQSLVSLVALRK